MHSTALIILNYNHAEDTRNCIESVLKYNSSPIKFIIVDNASRPEEQEALKFALTEIFGSELTINPDAQQSKSLGYATLITTDENAGYARGNNLGLEVAYRDEEIQDVLILNNDILFVEDIIPKMIYLRDTLPQCGIISPILYKKDLNGYDLNCARRNETVSEMIKSNLLHYWWRFLKKKPNELFQNRYLLNTIDHSKRIIEMDLPSGSCMLINKKLMSTIGGFDPHTFLYYEENILCKKMSALKLKNYLCLDLKCIHLGATTTKQNSKYAVKESLKSQYYYASNYSGCSKFSLVLLSLSQKIFLKFFRLQKKMKKA